MGTCGAAWLQVVRAVAAAAGGARRGSQGVGPVRGAPAALPGQVLQPGHVPGARARRHRRRVQVLQSGCKAWPGAGPCLCTGALGGECRVAKSGRQLGGRGRAPAWLHAGLRRRRVPGGAQGPGQQQLHQRVQRWACQALLAWAPGLRGRGALLARPGSSLHAPLKPACRARLQARASASPASASAKQAGSAATAAGRRPLRPRTTRTPAPAGPSSRSTSTSCPAGSRLSMACG